MKQLLFTILLLTSLLQSGFGQIQYTGCSGAIGGAYPYTLNAGTPTNDAGTIRNTYQNTPAACALSSMCVFRIRWEAGSARWEIRASSDGGASFPNLLYFNTTASFPDPPSLSLGTWADGGSCGGALTTPSGVLTGNVQNSVTVGGPEIDLLGNGNSIADGDVTPSTTDDTDFGNINLGGNDVHTFTIDNTAGTAILDVTTIVVSGTNSGDFVVSGITLPANIAIGATTTFQLTFTPSAVGVRNATVTVNNNDANEAVYDFAVRGTGVGIPEIDLLGNSNSIADGDVTPSTTDDTDFGNVTTGGNDVHTFTIDNTAGTGTLNVTTIPVSGANAGDFVVSGITLPANIAAGATTTFQLTFTPSAVGVRNATVTVNNNDANEAVYDFAVRGTGVAPEIDLLGNSNSIADGDVTPSATDDTDFGNVTTGGNDVHTFTIDNTAGTAGLDVTTIVVSGTNSGDFVVGGITLPANIAAGATTTFTLTFTPSAVGTRNATVTVNNNDANEAVYDFAVRGTGVAPLPDVAITEWLSNPDGNEATDEWIELFNFGASPVDIQNWRIQDEDSDNDVITTSSFVIPAGGYVILAKNKAAFQTQWLGGCPSGNVIEVAGITFANGTDEIIIRDASNNIVWSIAYQNDETEGRATQYTEAPTFTNRVWGSKASPGVDRSGNDAATGTLGYEKNNVTTDPNAMTSTTGDVGSPFDGTYTTPTKDLVRGDLLDFDGTNDYVVVPNSPTFNPIGGSITFECWARSNAGTWSGPDFTGLVTHRGTGLQVRGLLGISGTSTVGFWIDNISIIVPVTDITALHHYAGVYDGTTMFIYVDGQLAGQVNHAGGIINYADDLYIGRDNCCGNRYTNGQIDEVRVWNTARTANEIRENMHLTLKGCPTGLAAYYQMNDGTGSGTLADRSGNGNNGTLTNMDPATDWVTSGVNVGNDATNSNSQTITGVAIGASTQNFATANLSIDFTAHSVVEDIAVTYQAFTPNATTGATGSNIIQNPVWTVNKSNATSTQTMNMTFTFPGATLTTTNKCHLKLYNRTMGADGAWTLVGTATTATATTVTFNGVTTTGQFMVVEDNTFTGGDIVRGSVLDFDGTDDGIVTSLSTNTPEITVEAWFNSDDVSLASQQGIFHNGGDGAFCTEASVYVENGLLKAGRAFGSAVCGNGNLVTTPVVSGQWYHVAVVFTTTYTRLYLNGVEIGVDMDAVSNPRSNNTQWGVGAKRNGTVSFFNGKIDEARIWTSERTAEEIRENMHLTLGGCEPGLIAYFQMNEGSGTSVADKSGNGNNGTIVGGATWATSGVNVGNDASSNSNSQTINVAAGQSTATFTNANATMRFFAHSGVEDVTVTYQAFTPNGIVGADGVNIIQNPVWTVNKASSTETILADYTFMFPAATFTSTDPAKYSLYYRAMNSEGNWTKIATANAVTTASATFGKISLTGQFMVVQESENDISDVRGNMYNISENSERIFCPGINLSSSSFTIEVWAKRNSTGTEDHFFGQGTAGTRSGLHARYNINGSISFAFFNDDLITAPSQPAAADGEWHHLAFVYNSGTQQREIFIDGISVGSDNSAGNFNGAAGMNIGSHIPPASSGNNSFDGSLDEFRIWNSVRTVAEIRENMHLTLKGNEAGLISYYQFNNDDPVGTVGGVKDAVGSNDGTAQNMSVADYVPSEVAVAGGASDRVMIGGSGTYPFPNAGVEITFGASTPSGEIVVYRLETEKPHGWESIGNDVDNEYFVVKNYGTNTFAPLTDITFNRLSYVSPVDVGVPQASSPLQLYKRADNAFGATWGTSFGGADNASAGSNAMISYDANNNITSFSQIVLTNNALNSDLPVELMKFDAARLNADKVQLDWSTATEINNKGFYVERMLEAENEFEVVNYLEGQGTTTSITNYQVVDENSYSGVSYYRLKQIDFDGTITYSEIKAVAGEGVNSTNSYMDLSIYPNPVENDLNVRFNELPKGVGFAQVEIRNVNGQIVQEFRAGVQSYKVLEIEVKDLSPALYILSIKLDNQQNLIQKFIKN